MPGAIARLTRKLSALAVMSASVNAEIGMTIVFARKTILPQSPKSYQNQSKLITLSLQWPTLNVISGRRNTSRNGYYASSP